MREEAEGSGDEEVRVDGDWAGYRSGEEGREEGGGLEIGGFGGSGFWSFCYLCGFLRFYVLRMKIRRLVHKLNILVRSWLDMLNDP